MSYNFKFNFAKHLVTLVRMAVRRRKRETDLWHLSGERFEFRGVSTSRSHRYVRGSHTRLLGVLTSSDKRQIIDLPPSQDSWVDPGEIDEEDLYC